MVRITTIMNEKGYELSKQVYLGVINREKALDLLESKFGMNRGSGNDYVQGFRYMMLGECYKRTFNSEATAYFLDNIYNDFGPNQLALALNSVRKHIDYYNNLRNVKLNSVEKIYNQYRNKYINSTLLNGDELDLNEEYKEGQRKVIYVNAYERNYKARSACLGHYGYSCEVCKFDFKKTYGDIGENFIHVHHVKLISSIGGEYVIDPLEDLRPVCPNCHAMLHKRNPPYSIDELKEIININK